MGNWIFLDGYTGFRVFRKCDCTCVLDGVPVHLVLEASKNENSYGKATP